MSEHTSFPYAPIQPMRKALIIGALGQDGFYLTELLLRLGYTVIGTTHHDLGRMAGTYRGTLRHLDLRNQKDISALLSAEQPEEIYNLGARASSGQLSDDAEQTGDINGLGVTRLLEAIRRFSPHSRLCQALSSEIFAKSSISPQDEETPLAPANAYGAAKTYALHMLRTYRAQYDLFVCGAILYNHESPLRPANFVTRKVTRCVARIASGNAHSLQLGSASHRRDWGHARDHVRGMHLMLQHGTAEDFIIGTGVTHTIADLCKTAFEAVGLDFCRYVTFQPDPTRREEDLELRGDASKARRLLGWQPEISFEALIREMVNADLAQQGNAQQPLTPGDASSNQSSSTAMPTNTPPVDQNQEESLFPHGETEPACPVYDVKHFGADALAVLMPPQGTFVVESVLQDATPAKRSFEREGISFVICSIDDSKYTHVSARLHAICTAPHEIIRIDDARSLSEGYTRGIGKTRFDTVVLCHDDIDLLCDTALADILRSALHEFDVVGVAGPRVLKSAFWLNGGPSNTAGLVVHGPVGKPEAPFAINYYDSSSDNRIAVQALDGVFIAAKRSVFDHVQFDADLFDGFHLYDIDFTHRCHLAGLKLGVVKDFSLVHASSGNFGDDWLHYERRFRQKFPSLAAARLSPRQTPAVIYASSLEQAAQLCRNPDALLSRVAEYGRSTAPIDKRYSYWLNRTSIREIDTQLLAERMMLKWTKRPGFHLLMALHPGDESLLADTLDSLATQLYPDWLLSVVTDLPKPEGLDEIPNLQWLSLHDASQIDYVIDEVAAASAATWLARVEPGLTFEPHALQVFADYINARPMWHLMYCDEDTREEDGTFSQALFKPDLNLDLLRAQNYFGAFVLVEKEAFLVTGRYGPHRGAETYDLSLRVLDQVGPKAVGHVDQMLVHLPRASTRAMAPEAERLAVEEHLRRQGLAGTVGEGIVFGTRHIECVWPDTPLISIVIQTRDREEYLRPLLDSLHEQTEYSSYEIIIIDNETRDPDATEWLSTIASDPRWRGRATVLSMDGPFNWAAGANLGAKAASGEYLLFLDNDMHVVQKEWLSRLMAIAQRPEVGIVGPRLAFAETARVQETGWILGLNGLAGSPWKGGMELTDPGYMGRAVCDQNVGAVSGSALLVRASLLADCGGFDATNFPVFDGALDLCLRIAQLGKEIVWTPYSMIVHYGGVSMHERQKDAASALSDLIARKAEREELVNRWLPSLANDPAYNKHLSLNEPYTPEHIVPITWDTNFHDRTRILGIPLSGGAGEYRLRAPLRAIAHAGLAQTMICEPPEPKTVRILSAVEIARIDPDVIIFHQPVDDLQTESLRNLAKFLPGIRRIITIDDLVTAVPKKNSFHKFGFKDARPRLRKTLSLAERVVVSTQPLADFCAGMIDDIRVMPNCLERTFWEGAHPPNLPRRKPRIGWAGAQQHLGDLELIYPVVEALADEVDWIFMGMCPDPLRPFVHEFHDFVRDFEAYPAKLAQLDLDLAIAPLEINAFNEAKSNLRLLEYGYMAWPVICTDIFPYQNAPVTRLTNDPQLWISAIREQLAEPAAMQAAGKSLQGWVLGHFMLEDHTSSWLEAYGR
ncbi:MAG TPA: GDP-mannose 4,6-dehydratase [Thauera sp.]|nr:GDP-mannose 4,6-dehydratase [Thauera sp.]